MNPPRAAQTATDEDSRGALAWAILFYLQGRTDKSRETLRGALARDHFETWGKDVARRLQECMGPTQPGKPGSDQEGRGRAALLLALVKALDEALCPDSKFGPCYANESRYPRDPFEPQGRPDRRRDLALAAVLYLLRGHVAFRCRPKGLRDFNAAKVSLNDYFQCGHLAWRLYRALPTCHSRRGSQRDYLAKVVEKWDPHPFAVGPTGGAPTGTAQDMPEESEYFVWSTLLLLSIERGVVYREIDNLAESARFYRQMQRRLERLERALGNGLLAEAAQGGPLGSAWPEIVTPTVLEGLSEMSKVLFDGGFFLESLSLLTSCLAFLVKGTPTPAGTEEAADQRDLMNDCLAALRFLDAERHQSIVNGPLVCTRFGWDAPANLKQVGLPQGIRPLTPERFTQGIARTSLNFTFDLLARAGYILYTLCRGCIAGEDPRAAKLRNWLRRYFSAHEAVGTLEPELQPSRLGAYCMSLIGEATPDPKTHPRWEEPERELAGCVRATPKPESAEGEDLTRGSFFEAILRAATENIHNIVTIPARNRKLLMRRGYRFRREQGDLSRSTVAKGIRATLEELLGPDKDRKEERAEEHLPDKLVVLRRWQSFAPRIPRQGGERLRGGGYYLLWHGKGIVIDPGYDFIENFYDEGFSLADIHAVIVTHSHPDHDDDLSTLTTLIHEWNAYHELMGRAEPHKELDIFLNESANLKFSAWLKSSAVRVGRVIPLPMLWWDKASTDPSAGKLRGEPVKLVLRNDARPGDGFDLDLEIMPAWHDDVIGKTGAIGLKFHLFDRKGYAPADPPAVVVGYTGDTGAFGRASGGAPAGGLPPIETLYGECDVLIAHLGDARIRELTTVAGGDAWLRDGGAGHPFRRMFDSWFPNFDSVRKPGRIRELLRMLVALDLVPSEALLAEIEFGGGSRHTVCEWLEQIAACPSGGVTGGLLAKDLIVRVAEAADRTFEKLGLAPGDLARVEMKILIQDKAERVRTGNPRHKALDDDRVAWSLLWFLCGFAMVPWSYPFHLGVDGIYRLFQAMVARSRKRAVAERLFIVGELPEELASFRHRIAFHLNAIGGSVVPGKEETGEKAVHAFTGDIGLHVKLGREKKGTATPKIRCAFCNYNNETVLRGWNYHVPSEMREAALPRLGSAMIYLCQFHYPYTDEPGIPSPHLSRPNVRVV